jgi:hypothetical protein
VTHKNLRNYKLHSRVLYVIQLLVGPKISRVESLTYIFMVLITTRHLVHKHIEHGTGQNISKFFNVTSCVSFFVSTAFYQFH